MNFYYIECPWCGIDLEIPTNQLNCQQFVCGRYRDGREINPHLSAQEAQVIQQTQSQGYWGCLKPFSFDGHQIIKK